MHAKSQANAQAIFNLGYMHEHGQGLPYDLHLAKRYYDQALEIDSAARLPVTLALTSLWIRKNYADSFLVSVIFILPSAVLCIFIIFSDADRVNCRCTQLIPSQKSIQKLKHGLKISSWRKEMPQFLLFLFAC